MRTPLFLGLAAFLAAGLLVPSASGPLAEAAPDAPQAVVRTLELSRIEGALVGLDAESVTLKDAEGTERRFPLAATIDLSLAGEPLRRGKGLHVRAHLTDGSTINVRLLGGTEDVLRVEHPVLGTLEVLLDHVLTLEALPRMDDPCWDIASLLPRAEEGDIAYDTDGDEFRGAALEVNDEGVLIETAGKRERTVPWKTLRVLHLENDKLTAPKGVRAEIELQDGSRLRTQAPPVLEGGSVRFALQAMPKAARTVTLAQVRAVRWYGGQFVYASNLPFESKRESLYEGEAEPYTDANRFFSTQVDRRVSGCPLRIGGETFRHGFGVQSKTTITIKLDGAYASFRSSFGIDDEVFNQPSKATTRGNVDARVLGDGKVLWQAKDVIGGKKPRRIGPLDVKGVKVLVLEVGFGASEFGWTKTFDRADWGDPILTKSTK